MNDIHFCPCCGRHCDLDDPHCDRGRAFLEAGATATRYFSPEEAERRRTDYETMDMDSRLIVNLRDLGHTIRFLFEGKGSQKRILILLMESGGMTQRELTERIGVQPGSASEVVLKLEAAGLIQRTPSATDRRTTDIRLTESGYALAVEAAGQRRQRHADMFSCLSDDDKRALLSLVERLNVDWACRYPAGDRRRSGQANGHRRRGDERREGDPHGHDHRERHAHDHRRH